MQGDDAERIGSTWHNLVEAYVFAGRAVEAVELAQRGLAELERRGLHRTYAALTTGQLTLALLALGRWDRRRRRQRGVARRRRRPVLRPAGQLRPSPPARPPGSLRRCRGAARRAGTIFGAYDYTAGVCAAWEAELALWQRDWSRARTALARADEITAATDEIILELRLTALAMRLHADEYDWARTSASRRRDVERDSTSRRRPACSGPKRSWSGSSTPSTARSGPFHRALELARAERSRLDDRPAGRAVGGPRRRCRLGRLPRGLRPLARGRGAARRRVAERPSPPAA